MPLTAKITLAIAVVAVFAGVTLLQIIKSRVLKSEIVPNQYRITLDYPKRYKRLFGADWLYLSYMCLGIIGLVAVFIWFALAALHII